MLEPNHCQKQAPPLGMPHNNLLVSLMNAMGVPGTTFGEFAHCTGPLAGLL
ncbi:MAG: hypothetical protein Q8N23_18500 [Archangium sp.]|nr:hypothetical protein [Archangium sp.]MDP3154676.1 hypothetical protein [Archangium sp.]MDP3572696.1 hypothetical protein [Archangium sp.]